MFSNVGWGEIFLLFIVGLIVIGPERLPRLLEDARAALKAARTAINNAKQGLNDEFSGPEFDEFRKPLGDLASLQRMGPRQALGRALFDDDDSFLDSFDPKRIMASDTAGEAHRKKLAREGQTAARRDSETIRVERPDTSTRPPSSDHTPPSPSSSPPSTDNPWDDVT